MLVSPKVQLKAIVVARGLNQTAAATQLGITRGLMSRLLDVNDPRRPGQGLAAVIEAWTDGAIAAPRWLTEAERKRAARAGRAGKKAA
jgi:hypothetical protein